MDRKIYVNFVKGDNDKGTGTLEEPYKTLDHAYTKIRSAGDNSRLIFSLEGPQELSLEKYTNCVLEGTVPGGTDVVKVKTTSFSDMLIDIPMKIELPVKWDQEKFLSVQGSVTFSEKAVLSIVEAVPNKKQSYPTLTLIKNEGTLQILSKTQININRMITFINNENSLKTQVPNVESQGGNLFVSTEKAKDTLLTGNAEIKINYGNSVGYLTTSKIFNTFALASVNQLNMDLCTLNLTLLWSSASTGGNELILLTTKEGQINLSNSKITSNMRVKLLGLFGDQKELKCVNKINTTLTNVEYTPDLESIKILENDYTVNDEDTSKFHVDFKQKINKTITITIPSEIQFNGELYFKKMPTHHTNRIVFKMKSTEHPNGLTLDRHKSYVCFYKQGEFYYVKYMG